MQLGRWGRRGQDNSVGRRKEVESSKGSKSQQMEGDRQRKDCMRTCPTVPGDLLGISVFVL